MRGAHFIGVAATIVVGFLLLFVVERGVAAMTDLGYQPAALHATREGPHAASLSLATYPDSYPCHPGGGSAPDWVSYCPSTNLVVPAHSLVTVTIRQYDGGSPLNNPYFARVRGTVGGVMTVNGKQLNGLNSATSQISHTFTIQSAPDSPQPMFVSVPLRAVSDNAPNAVTINGHQYPKPNVIRFTFRTGAAGHYIWHCYDPCGTGLAGNNKDFGGPMATVGYMAGTLTVVNP